MTEPATDIMERLTKHLTADPNWPHHLATWPIEVPRIDVLNARDEIQRLRAEIERLRAIATDSEC